MIAKDKKNKKRSFLKNVFFPTIAVIFSIFIIIFLSANDLLVTKERSALSLKINKLKARISQAKERNDELKNKISQAKSQENLEEIARDQLNLKKPGEEVVVIKKEDKEMEMRGKSEEKKTWWGIVKSILFP